jgi:hypothetical protein
MKKEKSPQAKAVAGIRSELRKEFPNVKFCVKSFKARRAADVTWTDGPSAGKVKDATEKYQYSDVDDTTLNSHLLDQEYQYHPLVKYITYNREISEETKVKIQEELGLANEKDEDIWPLVHREFLQRCF